MKPVDHGHADCLGKARRLVEARLYVPPRIVFAQVGQCDDGAGAPGDVIV
jgi:hypothetical protein